MSTSADDTSFLPAATQLLSADETTARRRLRRMKLVAVGLLCASAVVFVTTLLLPETTAVGFVRAAAEAAMVGGLADWFAVTALFRHPLGLRVPHTALIPRQKDALATKLGEFVTGNFFTPDVVAAHVADARLVRRVGERLANRRTAATIAGEVSTTAAAALGAIDVRHVSEYLLELARRDVGRRSYAPVLGSLLAAAIAGRGQQPLVDVLARAGERYLTAHRDELRPQLKRFIEHNGLLAWLWVSDAKIDRLLDVATAWLGDMLTQGPTHPTRRALDRLLGRLADDLREDPATVATVDKALRSLVEDERVADIVHRVVTDLVDSLRTSLNDPDGDLEQRLTTLVTEVGERIVTDAAFAARLERTLERVVRYAVEQYGDQVVTLIQRTVGSWDARDAADRIEVAVGRDLQFIRINGTVVGALAGVAIHTVAVTIT